MNTCVSPILETVCDFIVDCLHNTAPLEDAGYPSIRTPNVGKGRLLLDGVNRVSEETYQLWTRRASPEAGDLILAREAPAGNVAIIKEGERVCLGQRTVHIRPNKRIVDPDFLCYLLLAPAQQGKLLSAETGATAKHVNMLDIRRLPLTYFPSLQTQQALGFVLAQYDDLIENNRRRMTLLEESARLLYQEWFVRLRFPGYEHTRIVDGVPKGWQRVPMPDAVYVNPKTKLSHADVHRYVEMADLPTSSMVISSSIFRDGRSGAKFQNGDTLFARITPCLENGKTGFVDFLEPGEVGRGSTEFIVLRPNRVSAEFVYCMSRTYEFRANAIKSMIGASGRQRVQESCFQKYFLFVPSCAIQKAFGDIVEPIFRQIKNLNQQNQKLCIARDLLLPRLMSGEILV